MEPGSGADGMWRALRPRGVFRGRGAAPRVAFPDTGQGSQYPNMLARLHASEPAVRGVFDEATTIPRQARRSAASTHRVLGAAADGSVPA